MRTLHIRGGFVVDPANGLDGVVADVWIGDGSIIAPPGDPGFKADRTIDARGYVVMPAGVDMHCHIAGSKVNAARGLRPEQARESKGWSRSELTRSGTTSTVPTSFVTGYQYAGLGYGTAVDAAIAPLGARHAHHEFQDTPIIDKGFLALMGNNHQVMDAIREQNPGRLREYMSWLLNATGALGVKVVNPGGVETWKQGHGNLATLDQQVPGFDVTPRQIMTELAQAVDQLGLPHPMHLHGLNLGVPGNAAICEESMRAIDGHRTHMAHIQFHSYGGTPTDLDSFGSSVGPLVDYVNAHPNLTVDVGQILFGETTSMTADGPVGQFLQRVTKRKWVSNDIEMETGCGIVPIEYRDKNVVHAWQWAIGLEWYLRMDDPWRIAMSTDHPNGGSFLAYPQVIALLMDRGLRRDVLASLPEAVRTKTALVDLPREYSLAEIAIITRAAPARILGLKHKGHLGIGADGDVTLYAPDDDKTRMFSLPRYLIIRGDVVLDGGELRAIPAGRTMHLAFETDPDVVRSIEEQYHRSASIHFSHFGVDPEEIGPGITVPCDGQKEVQS